MVLMRMLTTLGMMITMMIDDDEDDNKGSHQTTTKNGNSWDFFPTRKEKKQVFFLKFSKKKLPWNCPEMHCSEKGPYFREQVPIGTFFTCWVPIYISRSLFSVF